METKIVIWGAGRFGQYVCEQLKNRDNTKIVCFIDKNEKLEGKKIDGIEVVTPERLFQNSNVKIDYILIAFLNAISVYEDLAQYAGIKYGVISDVVFLRQLDLAPELLNDNHIFWISDSTKPLMRAVETNIVDYCNLNCKGCSHFSNLYKKGDMVPFEIYCRDLIQIANHINVRRFNLLGGEALLNNRLIEYMTFARNALPYSEIWVITNGLLLPKQDETFFKCCLDNNIWIDISEYKPTCLVIDEIKALLERYEIQYNIRDNKGNFGKNIDLLGRADQYEAMKHCREHACHFFRNGKLYKCPFEALGNKFFEHYDIDIRLDGGTDLYDEHLDWNDLVDKLENETVDACKYCGQEVQFTWEVSNQPAREDWIIN